MMDESAEVRIKRLRMRSIRRGIKEMDMLLTAFSEGLAGLSDAELTTYDLLLAENDHDILAWVTGGSVTPAAYAGLIPLIRATPVAPAR